MDAYAYKDVRAGRQTTVEQKGVGLPLAGIHKVRASDALLHQNMPPDVRRECARWFPESLWAVARDGFLGRARPQK